MTRLLRPIVTALLVLPLLAILGMATAQASPATLHFTANEDGAFSTLHSLGYNLHDTGTTKAEIDGLPGNDRAVVWIGEKCPTGVSSTLTSAVGALGHDSRVFAYYLSDEPHASSCAQGAANLAAEADYIHAHTSGQLAFIVLLDTGTDYSTFAPAHTHVDAVGLDPYPCNVNLGGCNYPHIDDQVHQAEAAGIAPAVIVPTFQAFADNYYTMPSPSQLQSILNEWAGLVPHPQFDYTYSWGCQGGSLSSCLSSSPGDQQVMAAHNGGSAPATPPKPPAPKTTTTARSSTTAPRSKSPESTAPQSTAHTAATRRSTTSEPSSEALDAMGTGTSTSAAPVTTATTDPTGSPRNHANRPHLVLRHARRLPGHHHRHHSIWSRFKRFLSTIF